MEWLPLKRSVAQQVGHAVGERVEVDAAVVVVEEEGIVERGRLARECANNVRRAEVPCMIR